MDPQGLQECCQLALKDLNLVLFYQPPHVLHPEATEEESVNEDYSPHLEDHMVLKFVVMAIAITHHLQKSGMHLVALNIVLAASTVKHWCASVVWNIN